LEEFCAAVQVVFEKIPVKSSSHELLLRLPLRNILNWSAEGYGVKTICLCALEIVVTGVRLGEGGLLKSSAKIPSLYLVAWVRSG